MSFRIFARGTGGFHHSRDHQDEGDVYDLAEALNRIQSLGGGPGGFVQDEVVSAVSPDDPLQQLLNTVGSLSCVESLKSQVTITLASMSPILVTVHARQTNSLSPDTSRTVTLTLRRGDPHPARYFLREIHPALEATDLHRFTVLCALATVFSLFGSGGSRQARDGSCQLLIQLSN